MTLFLILIGACLVLSAAIRMFMATYTPKAFEALVADEERRREGRNAMLKTGIGLAARFLNK